MEAASMSSLPQLNAAAQFIVAIARDAREGGENPPLPRNCERNCFGSRLVKAPGTQQDVSQALRTRRKAHSQATEVEDSVRLWEGG